MSLFPPVRNSCKQSTDDSAPVKAKDRSTKLFEMKPPLHSSLAASAGLCPDPAIRERPRGTCAATIQGVAGLFRSRPTERKPLQDRPSSGGWKDFARGPSEIPARPPVIANS